jgi:Ca2+-dependent lipid-binding protein
MKFQLTIEAEKLKRSNPLRNLRPYALVSVSGGSREGDVLGQTEVVENSLDPRWGAVVYVDTDASVYLPITVEIFDSNDGRDDKKIAEASFEVTAIYESQAHTQFESKGGTM